MGHFSVTILTSTASVLSDSQHVDIPERPRHAFEPIPGVFVQCQTDMQGQTRLIYSGPKVNNTLRQRIDRFLREAMLPETDI